MVSADHVDRLYRIALITCRSRALAEDLVQETYASALSRPRLLRRDKDPTYLIRALNDTWQEHLLTHLCRSEQPLDECRHEQLSPSQNGGPDLRAEIADVLSLVSSLPKPFREVVAAVDLAGLDRAEAAKALRIPQDTLSRRYALAHATALTKTR